MAKRQDLEERFLEMRLEGKTFQAISEELGVSKQSLFNWSKDTQLDELLSFGRMVRLQAVLHQYQLNREASVKRHGMLLGKCLEALEKKDFSELPADKLIKMVAALEKTIQESMPASRYFEGSYFVNPDFEKGFWMDVLD